MPEGKLGSVAVPAPRMCLFSGGTVDLSPQANSPGTSHKDSGGAHYFLRLMWRSYRILCAVKGGNDALGHFDRGYKH